MNNIRIEVRSTCLVKGSHTSWKHLNNVGGFGVLPPLVAAYQILALCQRQCCSTICFICMSGHRMSLALSSVIANVCYLCCPMQSRTLGISCDNICMLLL